MSGIGPALPPHLLAKRKRQQAEEDSNESSTTPGAKPSKSPDGEEKRRKVIGPAMPLAPLIERPMKPALLEESASDDDDGFGPALPPDCTDTDDYNSSDRRIIAPTDAVDIKQAKPQRDDWMTMPPKQDDLAARMDPTKIRARGFNTGKGAKTAVGDDNSAWNETPEEKRKRLQDEMMGISKSSAVGPQAAPHSSTRDRAAAQKIREQTEKLRGPSLLDQHQGSKDVTAEEDDPSRRAFDREKDMGSGVTISRTQRDQLLNHASGFSSKFSGGSYL